MSPKHVYGVVSCRERKQTYGMAALLQGVLSADRISDQGGGIAPKDLTKVWQYGYTTIDHQASSSFRGTSDLDPIWAAQPETGAQYRMGGLGFGLPMSRLYAEYFGKLASFSSSYVDTVTLVSCFARHIVIYNIYMYHRYILYVYN